MGIRAGVLIVAAFVLAAGGAAAARRNLPRPPQVSPIKADFREAAFATYYTVEVKTFPGRTVNVIWNLKAPRIDPACRDFFEPSDSDDNVAVWKHGDADGCDHTKMGPRGHLGTVSVTVSDGVYRCHALYRGTISGKGSEPKCETEHHDSAVRFTTGAMGSEENALKAEDSDAVRQELADSQNQLDYAIKEVAAFDGVTAAKALAHLRRAKTLDRLALQVPSKRKAEIEKALAEKKAALRFIDDLP